MTLDTLRSDLAANLRNVPALSPDEAAANPLLAKVLASVRDQWAYQEAVVEELDDMNESLLDMAEETEDILQPETAGLFVVVIQRALNHNKHLKRLSKDPKVLASVNEHDAMCFQMLAVIEQITIAPDEEEASTDAGGAAPETDKPSLTSVPASAEGDDANG